MNVSKAGVVAVIRTGWGLGLLFAPSLSLRAAGAPQDRGLPVAMTRVLGGRQVAQAVLTMTSGSSRVRWGGVATDALHAASGVAFALADPRWRRVALRDAVVAVAFTVSGVGRRTRTPQRSAAVPGTAER